jgi:tetratricopeptide (TPR) repeat protein
MPVAMACFILVTAILPYQSDAALARAIAFSSQGKWDGAVDYYNQAMRYNRHNIIARYFGASALLDRGRDSDLPEARRLLEGVKAEAPDYVLVNFKLWLLYNRLGLKAEAQQSLGRQIELDPLAAVFYLERGRLAFGEKRWEDAKNDFETATKVEPGNPSGWQYLGNLMASRGRFAEAIRVYEAGLSRTPDAEELNYNAAFAAFKLGDRKRARAYAEAALRKNPGNTSAAFIYSKSR